MFSPHHIPLPRPDTHSLPANERQQTDELETRCPSADLTAESPLFLPEAARLLPRGARGRPVHVSTLLRWITRGVGTPAGKVRLEGGPRWRPVDDFAAGHPALHRAADRG